MSWELDLLQGLAAELDDAGAGTYDDDGFTGTIVVGTLPDETSAGVGLNSYRIGTDDPAHPNTRVNVQFWIRGATLADLLATDSAIYDRVHGMSNRDFGTCHVTQAASKSSMPMGVDESGRLERASNYTFDLDLPATGNRTY